MSFSSDLDKSVMEHRDVESLLAHTRAHASRGRMFHLKSIDHFTQCTIVHTSSQPQVMYRDVDLAPRILNAILQCPVEWKTRNATLQKKTIEKIEFVVFLDLNK